MMQININRIFSACFLIVFLFKMTEILSPTIIRLHFHLQTTMQWHITEVMMMYGQNEVVLQLKKTLYCRSVTEITNINNLYFTTF